MLEAEADKPVVRGLPDHLEARPMVVDVRQDDGPVTLDEAGTKAGHGSPSTLSSPIVSEASIPMGWCLLTRYRAHAADRAQFIPSSGSVAQIS